jgi:hypothetical protein
MALFRARKLLPLFLATLCAAPARAAEPLPVTVEFNRDVRPILSENCFACHGPDKKTRKADLRLDTEEGAFADLGGHRALVPGKPEQSELYRRITHADPGKRMPLGRRGLPAREVALLRRWIEQGAKWQKHWSFLPPRRPPLPHVKRTTWSRNGLDPFILARVEKEGLKPSPEADPVTLLRRVTLDLTGLPPTPAEVDAFLADTRPGAYERVVERLLASPRYGERMAIRWLDAARYADSNGYQSDGERTMWRWRDWVIDAYNANLPYDRFTIEQIAGDLLPGATLQQKIATGFNRNHRGNGEGGIIPEEYAVEYVADRVETTATVWLGLGLGCARCHDHKFDPISQKEFYRVFAYFNNVPERGKAIKYGNSPPVLRSPTRRQQEVLAALDARLADARARVQALAPRLERAQARWEKSLRAPLHWSLDRGLIVHHALDGATSAKFRAGAPAYAPGRVGRAALFDGKRYLDAGDVANFGFYDKFTLTAWVWPEGPRGGTVLARTEEQSEGEGYAVRLQDGRVQVNLVKRWLDDAIRVQTEERLAPGAWRHVLVSYDGSRVAAGVKVYVNGRPQKLRVLLDDLNQSFATAQPLRIGAGGGPGGRFHGRIGDVRVYNRTLSADEAAVVATPERIDELARLPAAERGRGQALKLRACFLAKYAPADLRRAHAEFTDLREERQRLVESFPTTMVMEEMPAPRDTHVLIRGQYDRPGEKVTPGVPAVLGALPAGVKNDRLAFARWLASPANPLTARVAVNRAWQMYFGAGLVRTPADFGAQGEWPSHPELLDWLATEFVRSKWDVKGLQRLIVTSATYRQSSRLTPQLRARDPENRLLARGPRQRLSAEMIRDQALFASGLLVEELGGPSVKPYQPAGLWRELADTEYRRDSGRALYRRGLYTFWKRTVPPPALVTFDAAGREACSVRQARTNTPLQALNLLNDVTFVECARVLAQRVLREGGSTAAGRLTLAFRLAVARRPRPAELKVLRAGLERHRAHYRADRNAALALVRAGEAPRDEALDVAELAAYTAACSVILNLDEVITKE